MAEVVTATGMPVYGPATLAQCQQYITPEVESLRADLFN